MLLSCINATNLIELKQNSKNHNDLSTKLSNVEHRHNLLQEQKSKVEEEFKRRDEEQMNSIMLLKTESESVKSRLNSRLYDTSE